MGIYRVEQPDGTQVRLQNLATGRAFTAVCTSGYSGRTDELWYTRVLPPTLAGSADHVVFTSPYVLTAPDDNVSAASIDTHTSRRRWRAAVARSDFAFPRCGGTAIASGLIAHDLSPDRPFGHSHLAQLGYQRGQPHRMAWRAGGGANWTGLERHASRSLPSVDSPIARGNRENVALNFCRAIYGRDRGATSAIFLVGASTIAADLLRSGGLKVTEAAHRSPRPAVTNGALNDFDPVTLLRPRPQSGPRGVDRYPNESIKAKESGTVVVNICVSQAGRVDSVEIMRSSGFPRLDKVAVEIASEYRFQPATRQGRPMAACAEYYIAFKLT
jgi:TonB family protein